jgi:RibD C-terminal domain
LRTPRQPSSRGRAANNGSQPGAYRRPRQRSAIASPGARKGRKPRRHRPSGLTGGGLVEFVRDLKQQPGGDVGVQGSISVAQSLLAADVVDELKLAIGPMIAGRGRRLLDGLPSIQLESLRGEISPTGYLIVDYRVIR